MLKGDTEKVKTLLDAGANGNQIYVLSDTSVFTMAAVQGYVKITEALLDAGVNVDSRDSGGYTALMRATTQGNERTMRLLLAAGADINTKNDIEGGRTALMAAAAKRRHIEMVRFLLDAGRTGNNGASAVPHSMRSAGRNAELCRYKSGGRKRNITNAQMTRHIRQAITASSWHGEG